MSSLWLLFASSETYCSKQIQFGHFLFLKTESRGREQTVTNLHMCKDQNYPGLRVSSAFTPRALLPVQRPFCAAVLCFGWQWVAAVTSLPQHTAFCYSWRQMQMSPGEMADPFSETRSLFQEVCPSERLTSLKLSCESTEMCCCCPAKQQCCASAPLCIA